MNKSIFGILLITLAFSFYSCAEKVAVAESKVNLPGLQCESCVVTIKTALKSVDGVSGIEIDKKTKVATVKFDKSKTDASKIETAIAKSGYDANEMKKDMTAYNGLPDCCKID
ncbi:MAG: copper chaperone [Calditrichaeota bacterium]|nr:MAG: copper chaperone [Calditrichota bacterium]